jgi:hypothetical protein
MSHSTKNHKHEEYVFQNAFKNSPFMKMGTLLQWYVITHSWFHIQNPAAGWK